MAGGCSVGLALGLNYFAFHAFTVELQFKLFALPLKFFIDHPNSHWIAALVLHSSVGKSLSHGVLR